MASYGVAPRHQGAGRLSTYHPADDGSLSDRWLFVAQGSDGLTRMSAATSTSRGKTSRFSTPPANPLPRSGVPETPANLTFGGPEGTTLFITARASLYRVEMLVTGQ